MRGCGRISRPGGSARLSSAGAIASILLLGVVLGMKHALEADHVAAVAALATRSRSFGHTVWQGVVWGLGHTLTLLIFGGIVLATRSTVPERLAVALELAVGVMLIVLGIDVLARLRKSRVHFHVHGHEGGVVHVHAHAHAHERIAHDPAHHVHAHRRAFPLRALFVGMMHGMAGTATLILVMVGGAKSPALGLAQIAAFGAGSIAGMAALSIVIAIPLRRSARLRDRTHRILQSAVGLATLALGTTVTYGAVAQGIAW